jgi:hypothetical protein
MVGLVDIGIPELTEEQIEEIIQAAENAARKYIFSKIKQKSVENLFISVEAEGTKPINFIVEIELTLSKENKGAEEERLANEGVKEAFKEIENHLSKLI